MSISPEDMEIEEPQECRLKNDLSDVRKSIEASRKHYQHNKDGLSRRVRGMTPRPKMNKSTTGKTKRYPLSVAKAGMKQQRPHLQNIPFDLSTLMEELKAIAVTHETHLFDRSIDVLENKDSPINTNSDITDMNINMISDEEKSHS